MDKRLYDRLEKIEKHIELLKSVELEFLVLAAHEKVLFGRLFLTTSGNIEERKAYVHSSAEWVNFSNGLARQEADYLEAKRRYELKLKAYDAEHLTYKNEQPAIARQK